MQREEEIHFFCFHQLQTDICFIVLSITITRYLLEIANRVIDDGGGGGGCFVQSIVRRLACR